MTAEAVCSGEVFFFFQLCVKSFRLCSLVGLVSEATMSFDLYVTAMGCIVLCCPWVKHLLFRLSC